jgi:hypothetical protein
MEVEAEREAGAQVEATVAVAASRTPLHLQSQGSEQALAASVMPGTDVRRRGVPESRVAPAVARVWRPRAAPARAARLPAARRRASGARSARPARRAAPAQAGRLPPVPRLQAATRTAQMAPVRETTARRAREARRSLFPAIRPRAGASRAACASCAPTPRPQSAGRMAQRAGSARRIESPLFLVLGPAGVRRAAIHL